jgi:hypothetical protein
VGGAIGPIVCTDSTNELPTLLATRTLHWTLPSSCNPAPGTYFLIFYDPNLGPLDHSSSTTFDALGTAELSVDATGKFAFITDLYPRTMVMNFQAPIWHTPAPTDGTVIVNSNAPTCDGYMGTPLLIKMTTSNDPNLAIPLSSQKDGIMFDLLGLHASPPHSKVRISWTKSGDYRFLVKPTEHGAVNGIDEMFGDNTFGPDRKFASNGYVALAKYDANKDGFITEKDPVFKSLRLWADLNGDGVAQPNELMTLAEAKITSIDLAFDAGYRETDAYGNQTRLKSVAAKKDGTLLLVFDLWFRYLPH